MDCGSGGVVAASFMDVVGDQHSPIKCEISQVSESKSFNQLVVCLT